MESLIELVAASFARHGIECPGADSQLVWGRATSPVQAHALAQITRPAEPTALPEHNYRRSPQADPAP